MKDTINLNKEVKLYYKINVISYWLLQIKPNNN